jgi:hypothetical protein
MRLMTMLAALVLALAPGAASAQFHAGQRQQPQPTGAQAPQPPADHTERLVMVPPPGWQPQEVNGSDKALTTRLYPPGQNAEKWSEMLTVQVLADSRADAREYIQQVVEASRTNCEAAGPSPVTEKLLNGYPAAALTVSCTKGRQSGMGGLVLSVAIRGREALYVVQRVWRGQSFDRNEPVPVSQAMLQEWTVFSRGVSLCDMADAARHPCPKAN